MAGLDLLTLEFQEEKMGTLTIKDLPENVELDRKAMQAVAGGSRWRGTAGSAGAAKPRAQGLVDFKTGVATPRAAAANKQA
jgi:hypothetical protein